jgi:hypothetical protein
LGARNESPLLIDSSWKPTALGTQCGDPTCRVLATTLIDQCYVVRKREGERETKEKREQATAADERTVAF